MAFWKGLIAGLRGLFHRQKTEAELEDELRDYLERSAAEKMRAGLSRERAYRDARMEMGGTEAVKERVRSASWETHLETLWNDLRFGARLLRFNPGFAAAAILSLALGIGANTAIFQLLDAVRLRSLPVRNPQELARIDFNRPISRSGSFSSRYPDFTYAVWDQIRDRQQGFSSLFAWDPAPFNISPSGEVHNVQGIWVSGEYFDTLGVEPALGRLLANEDDQASCSSAGAVLSYSYWQQEYGGRKNVLGEKLTIGRHPFPIIGVAARDFTGVEVGRYFDVALPLCAEPSVDSPDSLLKSQVGWWLSVMGRLKPGWTVERAAAQLRAISPSVFEATLPAQYNPSNAKSYLAIQLTVTPAGSGISQLRKNYVQPLWLLLGVAGLVLLIASANLANLLLAKASAREKEMAMRMAIGASRGRLVRQLLAESLLLATVGTILGGLLAGNLSQVLVASLSTRRDPLFVDLGMDWRVLGFTAGLAGLTCILFGLAPAIKATGISPGAMLKEAGGSATRRGWRLGLRQSLVVMQMALSLALLLGALLFARSLYNLATLDAGFRRDGILVANFDFSAQHFAPAQSAALSDELLRRVRAIPGVDSAGSAAIVPLSGDGIAHDVLLGETGEPEGDAPVAWFNSVSPGYFETLQTAVVMGRDFTGTDRAGAPKAAIVNETFVKQFGQGKNPLEMRFRVRKMNKVSAPYQVVGVVKNTKYVDLREDPNPIVYTAIQQEDPDTYALMLIRSRRPLPGLLAAVKNIGEQADPNADILFRSFRNMIEDGLVQDRLMARLSGFFGVLAVSLALIGLYGVISYMVTRRRNEFGIRMALGAGRHEILRLVLREALQLLAIGLAIGIAFALFAGKAAASLLFGLKAYDVPTLVFAVVSLAFISLCASYLPALRASKLDPMQALRHE